MLVLSTLLSDLSSPVDKSHPPKKETTETTKNEMYQVPLTASADVCSNAKTRAASDIFLCPPHLKAGPER